MKIWRCGLRKKIKEYGLKVLVFSLLPILIFSSLFIIPLANNVRLHKQEKVLADIKLPEKTQLIEKQSVCGKLNGNGNGMNYLATILVKSNLSLQDLHDYYSDYEVIEQNNTYLESEYLDHASIKYDKLNDIKDFNGYYVILSYQSADLESIWEWDIRGH